MESAKVSSGIRKVKKKQAKDELDRIKQAEKKKRRLEKALATSAAIRSELEKKKEKKKEEQQRLDEEGAAIAEAVALHVLLDEDSDDSCKLAVENDEWFEPWNNDNKFDFFMRGNQSVMPRRDLSTLHSLEGVRRVSNAHRSGYMWNGRGNDAWTVSSGPFVRPHVPYFNQQDMDTAGMIAAQAVASLQLTEEDSLVDAFTFNRMLRG